MDFPLGLRKRITGGGSVESAAGSAWRMALPPDDNRAYRLAQLDDYMHQPRREFAWLPPVSLTVSARISDADLPGTWGFGFWNDPFSASLGLGGMARRLPALPNTAWFFHACERNYLSFSNGHPGSGFLSAVYRSPLIPSPLLAPAGLALPLLATRPTARFARRVIDRIVQYGAISLQVDPTQWRQYGLHVDHNGTNFTIDNETVYSTCLAPRGRLGLVLWIDNQYAAFRPDGRVALGRRENPNPAWLDVRDLQVGSTLEN